MRLRSFFGLLVAVGAAFVAAYHVRLNGALLDERFRLGEELSIPLWGALLGAFLAGFLPVATVLVVDTLRQELALRRERRERRERESREATYRRGVDLAADGQLVRAANEFEAFLAASPEAFGGLLRYGAILRELGRAGEAVEVHRRASRLYPSSVAVLYELAEDYAALGDVEVARETLGRIVREVPGAGLEVLRRRRTDAIGRRDWAEAAKLHEKITAMLSEAGDTRALTRDAGLTLGLDYQRGVLLLEDELSGEAAELFRRLLAHEPRFLPARIMLGEAELLAERPDEAIAIWRAGYLETGSPVFLQRIEDHFIEREEPLAALETMRALIHAADNDLLPRFFLGRLYYRLEMLDEAQRTLTGLGERIRSSPTYHFLRGSIELRQSHLEAAVSAYADCLSELGLGSAEYVCRVCQHKTPDWRDFCARCRSWNSIELDFEEERLSPEELGVQPMPVWGVYEDSGELSLAALEPDPES
jgi:lipopolysaccharide biosynthesis regulator YciM